MRSQGSPQEQRPVEAVRAPDRKVLDVLHNALVNPPPDLPGFQAFLKELAGAFEARGAGSALLVDGRPFRRVRWGKAGQAPEESWPWELAPELVQGGEARRQPREIAGPDGSCWRVAAVDLAVDVRWLLWLEDRPEAPWTERDTGALRLAAQVTARWLDAEGEAWSTGVANKRVQGRLEAAAAITSRLAHDFGNVLTAVCGFAELALMQLPAVSPAHRHVQELAEAAQNGAQLIQKLSLFSRRRPRAQGSVTLPMVIAEEAARARKNWPAAVELRLEVVPDLEPAALEGEAFRQVLGQLLDNAREALPAQGTVTLRARPVELAEEEAVQFLGRVGPGKYVEVAVSDTGPGLSPAVERRLLRELFVTTKPGHRGLGLAVVYGILQAYHGGLWIGRGDEGGTMVRAVLPLAAAPPAGASERRLLEKIAARGGETPAVSRESAKRRDSSSPVLPGPV